MLLTKGTSIRCALDTRIITTQPGFTRCQVMRDIYSANGKVLLLERGSKIIGEQTSALVQGQARVFVLWNEVETPNGVKISIASP
uniref:TrbI/VirB10 family protein n=1 Tax=Snodgrassella sp. CFCC 13594 TaxID=1775559 RepID=UPI000B1F0481